MYNRPPYGVNAVKSRVQKNGKKQGMSRCEARTYDTKDWDNERIGGGYFDLMLECSKEQIIFGGNYYTDILPPY